MDSSNYGFYLLVRSRIGVFVSLKLVDLFAGAGGLSRGLEDAGFKPVLASDIHPVYSQTYRLNHPDTQMITSDIRELSGEELLKMAGVQRGELDLLAGGPPCQGFSINAPIRSLDDQRNHLFKDFLRVAQEFLPKSILIENVPGIVSLGRGTVVESIYEELKNMGYTVEHKILFAGHYGIPQLRFRTIFIAIRGASCIEFPVPTHDAEGVANFGKSKELCQNILPLFSPNLKKKVTVWDAVSDLPNLSPGEKIDGDPYPGDPESEYQKKLRGGSLFVYNHICAKLGHNNLERLKHIPQGGSWRDIPFDLLPDGLKRARRSDHTKRYGRLHPDDLCSTILTKCDPHWGSFYHPTQDRAISVREAARIQSFPDLYRFTGNIVQQFEQVGNAVPPLLGSVIGKSIIDNIGKGNV